MKTRVLIKEGEYRLSKAGVMDAHIDAEELYCFLTGVDKVVLFLNKEQEADKQTEQEYFKLIERRASRVPLQHITGTQEFMGFPFKVSPDVLIPRQETEVLVTEAARTLREERKNALRAKAGKRVGLFHMFSSVPEYNVLDLCCGSGVIGVSMAKICEDVSVTAADVSSKALALACENARKNRVEIEFVRGNLFEAVTDGDRLDPKAAPNVSAAAGAGDRGEAGRKDAAGGRPLWPEKLRGKGARARNFDVIISNPPYIKTSTIARLQEEVKDHEPLLALDGGSDGLEYYRKIVANAHEYLKPGGWLFLEIGFDQGEDLRQMIAAIGRYGQTEIIRDLAGRDRVVKCQKA